MPIEAATFIADLNPLFPVAGDPVGQGDDHIRLIKKVLQDTFPNFTGPPVFITPGIVMHWSMANGAVPSGWGVCDGTTYARLDGTGNIISPNLYNRFILNTRPGDLAVIPDSSGGAASVTPVITVGGYSLLQTDLPNVNFTVTDIGHTHGIIDPGHHHTYNASTGQVNFTAGGGSLTAANPVINGSGTTPASATGVTVAPMTTGITVASGGLGNAHAHTASSSVVGTIPLYVALIPIIKL